MGYVLAGKVRAHHQVAAGHRFPHLALRIPDQLAFDRLRKPLIGGGLPSRSAGTRQLPPRCVGAAEAQLGRFDDPDPRLAVLTASRFRSIAANLKEIAQLSKLLFELHS